MFSEFLTTKMLRMFDCGFNLGSENAAVFFFFYSEWQEHDIIVHFTTPEPRAKSSRSCSRQVETDGQLYT